MGLKRVGRLGTAGALVAAAFGASVVFTPASASAAVDWQCHGTAVKRCAVVYWDRTNDTYKARAKIVDVEGGRSYQVKVTNVKLRRFNGEGWITVRSADDYDGWHDTQDTAGTSAVDPCRWPTNSFGAVATFSWRGASTGQETWSPDTAWGHACG
ncbi:putative secreted protein [Streptomyces davaonensis JCM 4913]|uniref:Putative secreted protein n=1 Tax=Streptomyces davaonensis (strain DSM 101723 / JCM 4913 / KCC S-0913 / 768) TaxID=1214101 RepID=K4R8I2_STRDJ|nr:hypothetical protein [Streptomyces davaonensis]CCK29432.1 putative secreted protein [Streptomyces davaonensis JCM 4913]